MAEASLHRDITVPGWPRDRLVQLIITAIVVCATLIAVGNLVWHTAIIVSAIWLALVAFILRQGRKSHGSLGGFLISCLGALAGREFIGTQPPDGPCEELDFGVKLFGRPFVLRSLPAANLKSIGWNAGQATSMSGRDQNDWSVCLVFKDMHAAPDRYQRGNPHRNRQVWVVVCAQRRRRDAEAFGVAMVAFLRDAGIMLTQSEKEDSKGGLFLCEPFSIRA